MDRKSEDENSVPLDPKLEGDFRDALRAAGLKDIPRNPLLTRRRQDIDQILEDSGVDTPKDPLPPEHRTPGNETAIRKQLESQGYGRKDIEEALKRTGFQPPKKPDEVGVYSSSFSIEPDRLVRPQDMSIKLTKPILVKPLPGSAVIKNDSEPPPAAGTKK